MADAEEFETGHHDRVTVLSANFNGTRILTGSIDHRVKVWARDPKTGDRSLIDTFTAHDSDIRDAKFFHPTVGSYIATIGNDLKFHLWGEDTSQAPRSGRRFRRVATIQSTPRVPFVSMDIRTTDNLYPTLALIDRQGLLSVYEPANPDHFKEWSLVDAFNVCGSSPPGRGEETSFKVRFDQNPTPLAYVNGFSDDRTQLSLVVSALNDVKIYRAITSYSGDNPPGDGASHRLAFYEAIRLHPHPALVRDVQWASFSVRGTDRIATACKDGAIRIFELGVAEALETTANDAADRTETSHMTSVPRSAQPVAQRQQPQSSLTTGLTGRAHPNSSNTPFLPAASPTPARAARTGHSFSFVTNIQSMTLLANAHTDAWSLSFDGQGQVLMSNGSDGVTKLWRKSVLGGQWLMFAGQEVLDLGEETDGEEEDEDEGADSD